MTLDEAIEQFKYDAECNRADLDLSFAEDNDKVAEWLEELKQYRAIGTVEECKNSVLKILEAYNKAIDDFKKEIKDAIDIGLEKVSPLSDVGSNLCTFYAIVDEIAEQLKGGDGE